MSIRWFHNPDKCKERFHNPVIDIDDGPAWLWVRHNATLSGWKDADDPIDDEIRQHFPHIKWETITA